MKIIKEGQEQKTMYQGIDLAQWNDVVDMKLAKASGVDFAILKVISKNNSEEPKYREHLKKCRLAGIDVIAGYTYSYANTVKKAEEAAKAFVKAAGGDIGIMVLDLEDATMKGLGHLIVDIIRTYQKAAFAAGMDFIIYTGAAYYNPSLKAYAQEIADIGIWWARYPSTDIRDMHSPVPDTKYLPDIPNEIVGWQYSSKGSILGINGYVDLNAWYQEIKPNVQPILSVPENTNPYIEPTAHVGLGTNGEGAKWVQWHLWRFGLLLTGGIPDLNKITGIIDEECRKAIEESQRRLGLNRKNVDGIVGITTRTLYKKTL